MSKTNQKSRGTERKWEKKMNDERNNYDADPKNNETPCKKKLII